MKKTIFFISCILLLAAPSCQKNQVDEGELKELVIGIDDSYITASVDTKATAVTSLPSSLYWGSTTGTRGNSAEARKYHTNGSALSGTVSSSKISTGKYQTATATAYNHYVSNITFSLPATGNVTMTPSNTTDVVCGWAAGTNSATPSVTLNHIFARTGSLTLSVPSGYSSSSVTWKIKSKDTISGTAGTYNLSTGAWTASSASLSETTFSGTSDLYLIPGKYTITVSFTLARGDFSKAYTQSCDITLVGNKINNITATTTTAEANQIVISLSLTAWSNQAVSGTLS